MKLARGQNSQTQLHNTAYLLPDNWDDFGYKTLFSLIVFDAQGNKHTIGNVKIGFSGQTEGRTEEHIPQTFDVLPDHFYSLGQDSDYYRNLVDNLSESSANNILHALRDVALDSSKLAIAEIEQAFNTSLTRSVNQATIGHQFKRILRREAPLTDYDFFYEKPASERYSGVTIDFKVEPNSKPSSNIHILIGRNGVGKTTLLNNMVDALTQGRGSTEETGYFRVRNPWRQTNELQKDYFAGVVSVSFSAFDPFCPPEDQSDANTGMRYCYIGLKKRGNQKQKEQWGLKDKRDLCLDFTNSLKLCFSLTAKKERWIKAVRKLESDYNFANMDLCELASVYDNSSSRNCQFIDIASTLFERMSSGHAIVLLTITKLVETVEEKTLVLIDEPESHLHPPLLSAFTRALSDLLVNRNGVAIVATHSPVVLQEVPKSCVCILRRNRLISSIDKPEIETFAENVGALTREVFGLEVSKSGFHDVLASSVATGKSYEEIEKEYNYQLGFEGKAILRAMLANRAANAGSKK